MYEQTMYEQTIFLVDFVRENLRWATALTKMGTTKHDLKARHYYFIAKKGAEELLSQASNDLSKHIKSEMNDVLNTCQSYISDVNDEAIASWEKEDSARTKRLIIQRFGKAEEGEDNSILAVKQSIANRWLRGLFQYPTKYGCLTEDRFVTFFSDPQSIFDNGRPGAGESVRFTDTVAEFHLVLKELFLCLSCLEGFRPGPVWRRMCKTYLGEDSSPQIDEMIDGGRLERFDAKEVLAALNYCSIYKERFCDGYFMSCCEDGIIGRLLSRLKALDTPIEKKH